MGYEHKVFIARKYGNKKGFHPEVIAELNLCGMPFDFMDVFDKTWEYGIWQRESQEAIYHDMYDAPLMYAKLDKVLRWALDNARKAQYRRLDMLIATLTAVRQGWGNDKDLIVIHYGY